jgi:hypothetical protein
MESLTVVTYNARWPWPPIKILFICFGLFLILVLNGAGICQLTSLFFLSFSFFIIIFISTR